MMVKQGLVNVPIEHHPTIGDIISKRYLKVMFKIPKKGHQSQPLQIADLAIEHADFPLRKVFTRGYLQEAICMG